MDVREKLVELLKDAQLASVDKCHTYEDCKSCPNYGQGLLCHVPFSVDHLIANGVTVQDGKDNDVPTNWIPVTERLPENFVSVLGYMPASAPFPPVRECYLVGNAFFFPSLRDTQMVTHWMPLPEPPKGECR